MIEFANTSKSVFYREYSNIQLIDDILYRQTEDQFGMNQKQLVLPKQAIEGVLEKTTVWSIVAIWAVERHTST